MKNLLMVALAATFALVTLMAGCAPGSTLNVTDRYMNAVGRHFIERDASGMPILQATLPSSSLCRDVLRSTLDIVRARTRSGIPSNEYRCEEFEVFGLRYRGEISCDICEVNTEISAKTIEKCEVTLASLKLEWQTILSHLESEATSEFGISAEEFQTTMANELKITECQLH